MSRDKRSDCSKWGYHNWEVKGEDSKVIVEVCLKCGTQKRYTKVNKSIDDKEYMPRHARDMLQPFDKKGDFKKEYGREN